MATDRQRRKAEAFAALHEGEPFVIPNPWDAGSARVLAGLGFPALATTSSGFAFTLGRVDGTATLEEVAAHVELLDRVTELPISADLENGYGAEPEAAARAVTRAAEAGAVGGSIEDWDPAGRLYDVAHAVERVAASVEAAGADVLYAPGLATVEEIRAVCEAVSRPVNVLAVPGLTFGELAAAGAQRVSVGGSLAWSAVGAATAAALAIRTGGDFSGLGTSALFRDWLAPG